MPSDPVPFNPVPSTDQRPIVSRLRDPALVGLAGASALVLLRARDPHVEGSYATCPFLALTGLPCPGCGGLRAVNDLTHGDVVAAISSNAFAVAVVVLVMAAWAVWAVRRARGQDRPMIALTTRSGLVVIAVALVFGAVRLTPWGSWLAP